MENRFSIITFDSLDNMLNSLGCQSITTYIFNIHLDSSIINNNFCPVTKHVIQDHAIIIQDYNHFKSIHSFLFDKNKKVIQWELLITSYLSSFYSFRYMKLIFALILSFLLALALTLAAWSCEHEFYSWLLSNCTFGNKITFWCPPQKKRKFSSLQNGIFPWISSVNKEFIFTTPTQKSSSFVCTMMERNLLENFQRSFYTSVWRRDITK